VRTCETFTNIGMFQAYLQTNARTLAMALVAKRSGDELGREGMAEYFRFQSVDNTNM
jgi:hypothetical protein